MYKTLFKITLILVFIAQAAVVNAQIRGDRELLAARGNGELTHDTFEARLSRIKPDHRFRFIRSRERMEDTLSQLLLTMQLESDAIENGFDQREDVKARMELAAREELARAWMENYILNADKADYEVMAREEYLVNQSSFMTLPTVAVTHILISSDDRSEEEAMLLADDLYGQLQTSPERFDEFVAEYSDDNSKINNKGSFTGVKRGDMVPAFEASAFSLQVGEISAPVKTPYGFHIIRKDDATPAQQRTYEEVKPQLIRKMTELHEDRVRRDYLNLLYGEEIEVTKESIENSIEQTFGPEVLSKYSKSLEEETD